MIFWVSVSIFTPPLSLISTVPGWFLCLAMLSDVLKKPLNWMEATEKQRQHSATVCLHAEIRYCKSRIFRMHFIFVDFVRGSFHTKIKCVLKGQSKSENPQQSVSVRKFRAYERSEVPNIRKFSANDIFWIYSMDDYQWGCLAQCVIYPHVQSF